MKKAAILGAVVALLLALMVVPSSAQLGDVGNASFTVQNVGGATATVSVTFVKEDGTEVTPNPLNDSKSNPFDLAAGESFVVHVPSIPGLAAGRYSVIVSSTQEVVAIVNLIGENAAKTVFYNGSYSGASQGASPVYLPSFTYKYYGWNSLISVQNTGTGPANVTVNFTCQNGATGSLSKSNLAQGAAAHFDLETSAPAGLPAGGCGGSAIVTSNQPVVVVDNQSTSSGLTQSFNTFDQGANTVYVPALYTKYYGWDASLSISKIGTGNSAVTVTYSDGGTSTCSLSDASPGCSLFMPTEHPAAGAYAATITATGQPVVAIANAANPNNQAQTYGGFSSGAGTVGLPTVMKQYYGWDTAFTCQNIGTVATSLNISYQNYAANAYDTGTLEPGDSIQKYNPAETFLPNGYVGAVTVTANASGGEIACIVNQTHGANQAAGMGDWSMSYNAQ
jgi:hypothetical protein